MYAVLRGRVGRQGNAGGSLLPMLLRKQPVGGGVRDAPRLPVCVRRDKHCLSARLRLRHGFMQIFPSQRRAVAATPNARLAVALGLGEANDIHPLRKKELAERCALAFDDLVFGKKVTLSPQPLSATQTTGNRVLITFDTPLAEGHVSGFEVSAGSQPFQNIEATAQGNTVELTLPSSILHPASSLRIRYAWKDNPVDADLRSASNALPSTSFEMVVAVQP